MGYRIEYPAPEKKGRQPGRRWLLVFLAALAAGLALQQWRPETGGFFQALLPGDGAVTAAALENLAQDLRDGEPVAGAWESFCRQILREGQLAAH